MFGRRSLWGNVILEVAKILLFKFGKYYHLKDKNLKFILYFIQCGSQFDPYMLKKMYTFVPI
jgi:hypothetical protein